MKKILSSFILLFSLTFSQDAIVVSPSTLDFGNVLMGNTPSLTFTINCNLDQPVSAGMYIYTIQAGEFRQTKKMVLLK